MLARAGALALLLCVACVEGGSATSGDSSIAESPSVSVPTVLSSTASVDSAVNRRADSTTENSLPITAPSPAFVSDAALDVLRAEMIIPVSGVVSGELRDTYTEARGNGRVHDAIDIPAARGTNVVSATPGRVLKLFTSKAGGLMV